MVRSSLQAAALASTPSSRLSAIRNISITMTGSIGTATLSTLVVSIPHASIKMKGVCGMRISFAHFGGTGVSCSDAVFPVRERDTERETVAELRANPDHQVHPS